MIKYNNSNINDWNYGDDNIVKVYRNNAVCYYKIVTSGDTPTQVPCYAVVDNISQYSDTEFVDVYNKADEKWYKLNNLNQYEEYGVYGSGRTITYYQGKLTIDDGYEYQYSGSSWVNVGEVSGSTILDNYVIPFEDSNVKAICVSNWGGNVVAGELTYGEAKQVTSLGSVFKNNKSITSFDELAYFKGITAIYNGEFAGCTSLTDIVIPNNVRYLGYNSARRAIFSGCTNLSGVTMISGGDSLTTDLTANNGSYYMNSSHANVPMVFPDREITMSGGTFGYYDYLSIVYFQSSTPPTNLANADINNYRKLANVYCPVGSLSAYEAALTGKGKTIREYDFETDSLGLLDKEKEWASKTSTQTIYPVYYDEKADPPNNLSFSSMTEAEEYECPWVGMKATIDGVKYIFSGDSQSGYEWVEIQHTILEYLICGNGSTTQGGLQLLNTVTSDYYFEVEGKCINRSISLALVHQKSSTEIVSYQMGLCFYNNMFFDYGGGRLSTSINSTTQGSKHLYGAGHISGSSNPNVIGVKIDGVVNAQKNANTTVEALPYLVGRITYTGHTASDVILDTSYLQERIYVYSVKIYTNYGETLVGDYIPVRTTDNVVTLYDKISGNYATPFGVLVGSDEV